VSGLDSEGRTIWIVDAHGYGKRFIMRADEKLTVFMQLESAIRSATRAKSACYENLPPDRAAKPYPDDYGYPALWQSHFGFSNSICAAAQPSPITQNRAEKLSSLRREP